MINLDLYLSFLLAVFSGIVSSLELSAEQCLEFGFRKTDLLCSGCDELIKFDLNELKPSCDQCCRPNPNQQTIKKKYSSARLEVCKCKFGAYPQVAAFTKSDASKQYNNFSIKYINGAEPVIKLFDSNDKVVDVLNIRKWDTDTIEEFLNEHLLN